MATYLASVICESLIIKANSEEEAEAKYDAFFSGEPCPCKAEKCDCVEHDDSDVRHTTELVND